MADILRRWGADDRKVSFHCPGCGKDHTLNISGAAPVWSWNGSLEKPTFTPSILYRAPPLTSCCHSYVTDGQIQFLDDCSHGKAGQTLPLPAWE